MEKRVLWIRITLMRILPIQLFTLMQIQIWIRLLFKVMRIRRSDESVCRFGVGRKQARKGMWPQTSPQLQGDFLVSVVCFNLASGFASSTVYRHCKTHLRQTSMKECHVCRAMMHSCCIVCGLFWTLRVPNVDILISGSYLIRIRNHDDCFKIATRCTPSSNSDIPQ
jgi:hypothetical protein